MRERHGDGCREQQTQGAERGTAAAEPAAETRARKWREARMRGGTWSRLLVLAGLVSLAGTACALPSLAAPERGVLTVTAHNYRYQPATIHLQAGQPVRLVLDNRDPVKHNISFRGLEPQVAVVTPLKGKQAIVFTPSKPGTYYMYCSEPGHEQLGMQGTAVVE